MSIENILTAEDISYIHNHPEVLDAKMKLGSSSLSYFQIDLTDSIRDSLHTHLHLDLENVNRIPMRWIQGDTRAHADAGPGAFEHTHLVYLSDSPGEFIIGDASYPIRTNTGFIFDEGLVHKTLNTGTLPRLLLGPMNEMAQPVGIGSTIVYYVNYADAVVQNGSSIGIQESSYIIGDMANITGSLNGITSWRIAYLHGVTPPTGIFPNGYDLSTIVFEAGTSTVYLYAVSPCFLEGTEILCQVEGVEKYLPIETLKPGTLVKTSRDGYKKVVLLGKGDIQNRGDEERIEHRLYRCSPENYAGMMKDIYITGCHSILVAELTDTQREQTIQHLSKIYITDRKYRLLACIDERAKPWASEGSYTIWHIALEHENDLMNYGIYASGLLVETCCIRTLRTKSNMTISSA
jgi:hypothetical protein